ncbi:MULTISPECIES: hypothetical protein [Pseudomonadota]|uniref:hypothetical protein n=1 Tax=Pseudomonadota TaxID=1224 RepID=UPI00178194B7|nr:MULTISPECIES: hypothetical protein [Pseudomonadota]MBD9368398.1 hypothetical protein [Xanthomonas sp. XNM01]MBV7539446.1 hypothetical protein [Duganella sp. sic0402]
MTSRDETPDPLAHVLEQDLLQRYGPVIGQDDLRQALGYTTLDAFRQALSRGLLPVPVFPIPHRRGKYALAKDIATWLAQLRLQALQSADAKEAP